jgi:hypothetical protein
VDGDGIDDASFVFSPISLLNLRTGRRTITIDARTLATSQFPNRRYTGTTSVTVTGGGGGGGGSGPGVVFGFGTQFQNLNAAAPPFGERFLPSLSVLARAQWAPLPVRVAYQQFLPRRQYAQRLRNFFFPDGDNNARRTRTLPEDVFRRGRFPNGVKFGRVNHGFAAVGDGQHYGWPYRNRIG